MQIRVFQRALLAWYSPSARSLPWRETTDPYRVLVSEVMLQQTQAARVLSRYDAFLERFPDVQTLAAASTADVLIAWQGLGYNRRALSLQAAAKMIVAEHGGVFPTDLADLKALPGIGDYTARAILAFAFNAPAAPVDTNVARVLSRALVGAPLGRAEGQRLADAAVPTGRASDWGNALMDLGAMICTARAPQCVQCPLQRTCAWQRHAGPDPAAIGALRPRPQATFAGSDRFHRGRLVDALRVAPVPKSKIAAAAQLDDPERLDAITQSLIRDGLATWTKDTLQLP